MKRLLFALFLMAAISVFAAMPALAADACTDDPALHQPTAASLILHVQHAYEMGHIKQGLVPALTAPLNTAAKQDLPVAAQVRALQAFIDLAEAQAGKGITADCAQHLITQAQQAIVALGGQA